MKNALEIVLHDDIQNIFDHFAASFGLVVVFYSLEGKILRRGLNLPVSDFCALVQQRLYGTHNCLLSDETRCRECAEKRRIMDYRCNAGIEEAVAPIFVDNQLTGYAMIGQFRSTLRPDPRVLRDARKEGIEPQMTTAFYNLPYYDAKRKKHLLGLFSTLVDYIITKEIVAVRGERIISRVMAYIEQHIDKPLRLTEVARVIGRSTSSVSHAFSTHLHKSFSQAVIEAKINRAEEYFRQSPEISIREVADQLGYNDALYFSRLYRKYRGISPSQFRTRLQ